MVFYCIDKEYYHIYVFLHFLSQKYYFFVINIMKLVLYIVMMDTKHLLKKLVVKLDMYIKKA